MPAPTPLAATAPPAVHAPQPTGWFATMLSWFQSSRPSRPLPAHGNAARSQEARRDGHAMVGRARSQSRSGASATARRTPRRRSRSPGGRGDARPQQGAQRRKDNLRATASRRVETRPPRRTAAAGAASAVSRAKVPPREGQPPREPRPPRTAPPRAARGSAATRRPRPQREPRQPASGSEPTLPAIEAAEPGMTRPTEATTSPRASGDGNRRRRDRHRRGDRGDRPDAATRRQQSPVRTTGAMPSRAGIRPHRARGRHAAPWKCRCPYIFTPARRSESLFESRGGRSRRGGNGHQSAVAPRRQALRRDTRDACCRRLALRNRRS
jgi:hypothetical protein